MFVVNFTYGECVFVSVWTLLYMYNILEASLLFYLFLVLRILFIQKKRRKKVYTNRAEKQIVSVRMCLSALKSEKNKCENYEKTQLLQRFFYVVYTSWFRASERGHINPSFQFCSSRCSNRLSLLMMVVLFDLLYA